MDLSRFTVKEGEEPLDNLIENGGLCSIFRTIAVIGDSLSSGEFQITKGDKNYYYDMYEYSWGQFIARACSSTVYNFSRGGMSAKEYCESFAKARGFWGADKKAQAYIFALGVNDKRLCERGDISDVTKEDYTKNGKTFMGYYAQIISRYKLISPHAKFFLITMPLFENEETDEQTKFWNEGIRTLASTFDCYLIDLEKYMPRQSKEYKAIFYQSAHLNPIGYYMTACVVSSYIDYIIRKNPKDFNLIGFINNPPPKAEEEALVWEN